MNTGLENKDKQTRDGAQSNTTNKAQATDIHTTNSIRKADANTNKGKKVHRMRGEPNEKNKQYTKETATEQNEIKGKKYKEKRGYVRDHAPKS